MNIHTDFCGGNAVILSEENGVVKFRQDLRDTDGDWFYWAFAVEGAAGTTVRFEMPQSYIGYFGAAVSHDLYHWDWTHTANKHLNGFSYTFGRDENKVYFAHHMLYHPSRFLKFAELHGLRVRHLCDDNKGTPISFVTVGEGSRNILLTSRHHCCESTGDYIMEGIIDEFIKHPIPDCRVTAIPFIDADGVIAGDQGKNRRPHDHNRDYGEWLYSGTRAVRDIVAKGDVIAAFDLHSPWHISGRNDKVFCVRNSVKNVDDMKLFGKCFESSMTPDAMIYRTENDINPNEDWNDANKTTNCGSYCLKIAGVPLAFSLETTYFGEEGNVVSQDRLVATGRCFLEGFRKYLIEKGMLA